MQARMCKTCSVESNTQTIARPSYPWSAMRGWLEARGRLGWLCPHAAGPASAVHCWAAYGPGVRLSWCVPCGLCRALLVALCPQLALAHGEYGLLQRMANARDAPSVGQLQWWRRCRVSRMEIGVKPRCGHAQILAMLLRGGVHRSCCSAGWGVTCKMSNNPGAHGKDRIIS